VHEPSGRPGEQTFLLVRAGVGHGMTKTWKFLIATVITVGVVGLVAAAYTRE
jgi:hypothetical protein